LLKLPIACSSIPSFMEIGDGHVCTFSNGDDQDVIAGKILSFLDKLSTHILYRKVIDKYSYNSIYQMHIKPMFLQIINN